MECLRIVGGKKLSGTVKLSGAKNAALPLLFSSLLTKEKTQFLNIPNLSDIHTTFQLLEGVGAKINYRPATQSADISIPECTSFEAPYDLVRTMRASILILAPLLARKGEARVSLPGGCAIGARPVDLHLQALEALGAKFKLEHGYVHGRLPSGGFVGAPIRFPFPSVGATETALMACAAATGTSVIHNAAREPEITDLANFLESMGARIEGKGTSELKITGATLVPTRPHSIIPDRIEAATYFIAGLATGGSVRSKIPKEFLTSILAVLQDAGAQIRYLPGDEIEVSSTGALNPITLVTAPFPGFPTDAQAQLMALMTLANGQSTIEETIFENRFMHVPELVRLAARLTIHGNQVIVDGPSALQGATVMATDLRASASLIIAALAANGETKVRRIYHLDRGYEDLHLKLQGLGAEIYREEEN
jgi:UDP-N-acetylglucosamine 1-carboxyvinyltransferase